MTVISSSLARLARQLGIALSYRNAAGHNQEASSAAIEALAEALGCDPNAPAVAVRTLERAKWTRVVEPVAIAWEGQARVLVRTAEALAGVAQVSMSDGRTCEISLPECPVSQRISLENIRLEARVLTLPWTFPLGYHDVFVELAGSRERCTVISTPRRTWRPSKPLRTWGGFLPLHATCSQTGEGIGNLSDLSALIADLSALGGTFLGTLPLLSAFHDGPCEPSPYSPVSRLYWNELYLDITRLPEYQSCAKARALYVEPQRQAAFAKLRSASLADARMQARLRRPVLDALANHCMHNESTERQLARWSEQFPGITDYAKFRAAAEKHGSWSSWPQSMRSGTITNDDFATDAYHFHLYVQFRLHDQLTSVSTQTRETGLGLYLDLPVGVDPSGYDAWRHHRAFVPQVAAGAPPDGLFEGGQNWGFAPFHPTADREAGYPYFRAIVRNHCRYAGVLRIDHIMSLHRIYCIPQGFSAREGLYLQQPGAELTAILCLESHINRTLLVGENLGTVPPETEEAIRDHGLLGMHVQQFGLSADEANPIASPPPAVLAGLNTHDTPTFAAYWTGTDIDLRTQLSHVDHSDAEEERHWRCQVRTNVTNELRRRGYAVQTQNTACIRNALLTELARSDAAIVSVNLEDLSCATLPQNVPGTSTEYANWRRRIGLRESVLSGAHEILEKVTHARMQQSPVQSATQCAPSGDGWFDANDLYLFNEGTHRQLWRRWGAHPATINGVSGTHFAVWAPSARAVSVVGEFNGWNPHAHALQPQSSSGVWAGFIPHARRGQLYKYSIDSPHNPHRVEKADPVAFYAEQPPRTASRIWDLDYQWHDDDWMKKRGTKLSHNAPVSIYELHLASWRRVPEQDNRPLTYQELAHQLADYVDSMGYTHVELMPVMEHPFSGSWGYQVTGYFAPTSRYGVPQDLMYLIDQLHQRDIGVILDWVPSHFPSDAHGLAEFDGTHLYEHADPRQGFHPDWKSCIPNYGRREVRSFLISSALYWLDVFHADGLRVDGVASMLYLDYSREPGEWIANRYGGRENLEAISLLRTLNEASYADYPGTQMIAEESTAWGGVSRPTDTGGLGFGYKWDMGWMHDTLSYMSLNPVHRRYHHGQLTFRQLYAFTENFVLSLSHDEVVHGKGSLLSKLPGDRWQQLANLRLLYGYMWGLPGKKLVFMGQDFAMEHEWNHDQSIDWHLTNSSEHAGIQAWVRALNATYRQERALHELDCQPEGFRWIEGGDSDQSVLSFLRLSPETDQAVAVACNFTPVVRHNYRIGVPQTGAWHEILNSDAHEFGGSGVGNHAPLTADAIPAHGFEQSLALTLPPLAAVFLIPTEGAQ